MFVPITSANDLATLVEPRVPDQLRIDQQTVIRLQRCSICLLGIVCRRACLPLHQQQGLQVRLAQLIGVLHQVAFPCMAVAPSSAVSGR